jgi:hypothetical protein
VLTLTSLYHLSNTFCTHFSHFHFHINTHSIHNDAFLVKGIITHSKCHFNTHSYAFFRRLSPFMLTMLYRNKVAQVPSQHKRCNPCLSVVVATLVHATPSAMNMVVVANPSVATLSATNLVAL